MENESTGLKIKLEIFEGPLELLVHLIEKNKIDLYDIPIAELTNQYLDYLQEMQTFDIEIASEFLVMASTLLHIKSKMLLPVAKTEEDEEEVDPREELIMNIIEYKRIKNAAQILREHHKEGKKLYYKYPEVYEFSRVNEPEELDSFELIDSYLAIVQRHIDVAAQQQASTIKTIVKKERVSIKSRIKRLMKALVEKPILKFSEVFGFGNDDKESVMTGLMASLELAKAKRITLKQRKAFMDIDISLVRGKK